MLYKQHSARVPLRPMPVIGDAEADHGAHIGGAFGGALFVLASALKPLLRRPIRLPSLRFAFQRRNKLFTSAKKL